MCSWWRRLAEGGGRGILMSNVLRFIDFFSFLLLKAAAIGGNEKIGVLRYEERHGENEKTKKPHCIVLLYTDFMVQHYYSIVPLVIFFFVKYAFAGCSLMSRLFLLLFLLLFGLFGLLFPFSCFFSLFFA